MGTTCAGSGSLDVLALKSTARESVDGHCQPHFPALGWADLQGGSSPGFIGRSCV